VLPAAGLTPAGRHFLRGRCHLYNKTCPEQNTNERCGILSLSIMHKTYRSKQENRETESYVEQSNASEL